MWMWMWKGPRSSIIVNEKNSSKVILDGMWWILVYYKIRFKFTSIYRIYFKIYQIVIICTFPLDTECMAKRAHFVGTTFYSNYRHGNLHTGPALAQKSVNYGVWIHLAWHMHGSTRCDCTRAWFQSGCGRLWLMFTLHWADFIATRKFSDYSCYCHEILAFKLYSWVL